MSFTRRALLIGAMQGGLMTVLAGRLAWLQVVEGHRYKTLAENNRINVKLLAPSRGLILDRYGVALAENSQNFRALVVPEQTTNLEQVLNNVARLIPLKEGTVQTVLKTAKKSPRFASLEIRDNLSWDEVATIEVNLPDLPGVSIDVGEVRYYPLGEAVAHMIGYVGAVDKADQTTDDPLLRMPGFKIGKTGLEKVLDGELRGRAGAAEVEVNVVGREVRELSRKPGEPGRNVTLTIDSELQDYVRERLSVQRSASAVIMDAKTGAVYAMASVPSFDPNEFSRGLTPETWNRLLADPGVPLNNKAIGGQYPPGSTYKMVTAMAGLESGAITPGRRVFCPGHFNMGDTRFHCWKQGGHGSVDLVTALAQSCDTYFYQVALDIGIDKIGEMANRFGLGVMLDTGLAEERKGLIPTQAWKRSHLGQPWHRGETVVASIGQGYVQATPLQLAVMTARLVNGGHAVMPQLTAMIGDVPVEKKEWPSMGFNPAHLAIVRDGMEHVVMYPRGTAYGSRITVEGMEMAGKTGTSQVRRITKEQRALGIKNEDLPWNHRHHALFVGYAPYNDPRYVVSVVVEHGGGGSAVAAPIAKDLILMAQQRNPAARIVSPDGHGAAPAPMKVNNTTTLNADPADADVDFEDEVAPESEPVTPETEPSPEQGAG